jgi:hypothetical protein
MVGVEDRNEDVAEEDASRPSSLPNAAAPVPTPSAKDGGVIFVLDKAFLEAAKVGKVKKTKEIPFHFLSGEEGGEFFFRGSHDRDVHNEGDYKGDAIQGQSCAFSFVEVSGGELWVHVLQVLGCLIFCTISFSLSLSFPVFHNYGFFGLSDLHSFLILQQTQFC